MGLNGVKSLHGNGLRLLQKEEGELENGGLTLKRVPHAQTRYSYTSNEQLDNVGQSGVKIQGMH